MTVSKADLLRVLPPYKDEWVTVVGTQDVHDIIKDMLHCHYEFAGYYDLIAPYFDKGNLLSICEQLKSFCEDNIRYKEETEGLQTTALPTGFLTRGYGDCKHYASFIGGVLGALQRLGHTIDWSYCFASYDPLEPTPYHVFVVVNINGEQYFVDPTPGADAKTPFWVDNRKVKMIASKKIAGLSELSVGPGGIITGMPTAAPGAPPGSGPAVVALQPPFIPTQLPGLCTVEYADANSLPLPDGYPEGLPQPYIDNSRLLLNNVPPNFQPTIEQMAYMALALQLWIYQYSAKPYNIFTYNANSDNTGLTIGDLLTLFCSYYRNPAYYSKGQFGYYTNNTFNVIRVGDAFNTAKNPGFLSYRTIAMETIDFSALPVTDISSFMHTAGVVGQVLNSYLFKWVAGLIPVVGSYFQKAIAKAMNQPSVDEALRNQSLYADVAKIQATIAQNEQTAAATGSYNWLFIIAAVILGIYYWPKIEKEL
jgi:hypothetical protein